LFSQTSQEVKTLINTAANIHQNFINNRARSRRGHKYTEKYDSVNSISINNKKRMSKKNIKKDSNGNLKLL